MSIDVLTVFLVCYFLVHFSLYMYDIVHNKHSDVLCEPLTLYSNMFMQIQNNYVNKFRGCDTVISDPQMCYHFYI